MRVNFGYLSSQPVAGFSLVEVLVTVVIVGFGLLGVALMQGTAIKSGQEAWTRSQASHLATDLLSKMVSSPTELGVFQSALGAGAGCDDGSQSHDVSAAVACWKQRVNELLPGSSGDQDGSPADQVLLEVAGPPEIRSIKLTMRWWDYANSSWADQEFFRMVLVPAEAES